MQQKHDSSEIERTLELLHPEGLFEVAVLTDSGMVAGVFNSPAVATSELMRLVVVDKHRYVGCYTTLNELRDFVPCLRPLNKLVQGGARAKDDHMLPRRRWGLIDVDASPASGVSANLPELAAAKAMRDWIADWLTTRWKDKSGFRVVKAFSGNGYHLLVEDPPAWNTVLLESIRDIAAAAFPASPAHVDVLVEPSRLTKLYGTWARKGYEHGQRVHRKSEIEAVL